jgi:hypothetical protein
MVPSCYVDGTDFMVRERSGAQRTPQGFSHKFHHAGLRYMIATAMGCSKIIKIAGGLPAGANPDKDMAMKYLIPHLLPGERPAADQGYRDGNSRFFTKFSRNGILTPDGRLRIPWWGDHL